MRSRISHYPRHQRKTVSAQEHTDMLPADTGEKALNNDATRLYVCLTPLAQNGAF